MPVTELGELVRVHGARSPMFMGGSPRVFWVDPREPSPIFYSERVTEDGTVLGYPFEPLASFGVRSAEVLTIGSEHLMVFIGSRSNEDPLALYVLRLDPRGVALEPKPRKIWEFENVVDHAFATRARDALIAWIENHSLRVLRFDATGRLLDWSAPAEELAGRSRTIDVARIGDRYLLLVTASATDGSDCSEMLVPLIDSDPAGPPLLLRDYCAAATRIAGGETSGLIVRLGNGLGSALVDANGGVGQWLGWLLPYEAPSDPDLFALDERSGGGWAVAYVSAFTKALQYFEIEPDNTGELYEVVTTIRGITNVTLDTQSIPRAGVSLLKGDEGHWLALFTRQGSWLRSDIASHAPQRIVDVAASETALGVILDDPVQAQPRHDFPGFVVDTDGLYANPAITSDGTGFLLESTEVRAWDGGTLHAIFLDESGTPLHESDYPFVSFTPPVVVWSGDQYLHFFSTPRRFRLTLIPGDVHVVGLTRSGSAQSHLMWQADESGVGDVWCGEEGCAVVWSERDLSDYCDVCEVPARSLFGRTTASGDLVAEPVVLVEENREMRVTRCGPAHLIVSWNGMRLTAETVDEAGSVVPLGTIATPRLEDRDIDPFRFDVAPLAGGAVVVWVDEGAVMGRAILDGGAVTDPWVVADGVWRSTEPHLVERGGEVWLLYERIDAVAGYVPRAYARRIVSVPRPRAFSR